MPVVENTVRKIVKQLAVFFLIFLGAGISLALICQEINRFVPIIWLPFGIAFGTFTIWGNRVFAVSWVGFTVSFLLLMCLFNKGEFPGGTGLAAAAVAGMISTVSAWKLARLAHREFIDPESPPLRSRGVFRLVSIMLASGLAISSAVVSTLCWAGIMSWEDFVFHLVNWYLAGMLGVVTISPIIMLVKWGDELHEQWAHRIALPLTVALFFSLLFLFQISRGTTLQSKNELSRMVDTTAERIKGQVRREIERIDAIHGLWDSSKAIDLEEFRLFSRRLLSHEEKILQLVGWAPWIENENRHLFESLVDEVTPGLAMEPVESFMAKPLPLQGTRKNPGSETAPITYLEPESLELEFQWSDLFSHAAVKDVAIYARVSGKVGITPILKWHERSVSLALVWIDRFPANETPNSGPIEGNLDGFAIGMVDVGRLMELTRTGNCLLVPYLDSEDVQDAATRRALNLSNTTWWVIADPSFELANTPLPWEIPFAQIGVCLVDFFLAVLLFFVMWRSSLIEDEVLRKTNNLAETESRFRLISEAISEVFWISSLDGEEILYLSPAFESMWGIRDEEVYANISAWFEATHPDDRERVKSSFYEEATLGTFDETYRIIMPDGTEKWIRNRAYPVEAKENEPGKLVGVAHDITKRIQVERDLMRSNEELAQFAYVASHDLREPLRMVTSYVQLLERKYKKDLDESACQFISFAVEGSMRMRRMIDDLLQLSHIDSKGKPFEETDLDEVVEIAMKNLEVVIAESNANLLIFRPLPLVRGDEIQLIRLFQNLISNAIKFSGDQTPEISILSRQIGAQWWISVTDNGLGIPEDQMTRIFRVFQRLHREDEVPGTGIGLAVCKRIVERHGGTLTVRNNETRGCTFEFQLPA